MNVYAVGPLLASFSTLGFGLFALASNPRAKLNQLFFGICVSVFLWAFGYSQMYNVVADDARALMWARTGYIGVPFIPVFVYHFLITFLELKRPKLIIATVYALGCFFLLLSRTDLFLNSMYSHYFWGYYPKAGPLYFTFVFFFAWIFVRMILLLYQALRLREAKQLPMGIQRIKYVLLGFAIATTSLVDYLPNYRIHIYPWAYLSALGWLLCMGWASFRYRLLDIKLAIARTAIFMLVYALVLGVPLLAALAWQTPLEQFLGPRWWVWLLVTYALLATAAHYSNLHFQQRAEDRLMRVQRQYQTTLMNAAKGMVEVRDLQRLLNLIVHLLTRAMKLTHAGIFLLDEKTGNYVLQASRDRNVLTPGLVLEAEDALIQWLRERQEPLVYEEVKQWAVAQPNGTVSPASLESTLKRIEASVVVPSISEEALAGFLVLGDKKTGQMFSQDDLNVLQTLANQGALGIQNARFYEELQSKTAELIHTSRLTSMGKMATGVAHQMRNRFACLMGEAELAQVLLQEIATPGTSPQKQQELLQQVARKLASICEEGQKGLAIVKSLLEYSQPAQKPELISLREVLDRGLGQLSIKYDLSQFAFYLNVPQGHPYVYVTPTEWQDVFFNLLDNACYWTAAKASRVAHGHLKLPENELPFGPKIAVTTQPSEDRTKFLIRVSDNGLGIEPKEQDKLFIPFFTLKGSSEEKTGIGLWFVWTIVKAHGGTIQLERSEYGKGTSFLITLPIPKDEQKWLASGS